MCLYLKTNYVAIVQHVLSDLIKKKDNFCPEVRYKVCFLTPKVELSMYLQLITRRVLNACFYTWRTRGSHVNQVCSCRFQLNSGAIS